MSRYAVTCLVVLSWLGVSHGQVHTLTPSELQQCTNDLACSINYSNIFQSKLDNATHYMELELDLLRHQTNNILVPVQTDLAQLKMNQSREMSLFTLAIARMENELAGDR